MELCPGWEWDENTLTGISFVALPLTVRQRERKLPEHWRESDDSVVLDALAAELVRQCQALPDFGVRVYEDDSAEVAELTPTDNPLERYSVIEQCDSVDRTMNTIRAIVDSKVLEQ